METTFIVIAREDSVGGKKGRYTLATRTVFDTETGAFEYACGISPSREPLVVGGDFAHLRFDAKERGFGPKPLDPLAVEELGRVAKLLGYDKG